MNVRAALACHLAGSDATGAVRGVAKNPGAMAFAVTPLLDHASACARVSCMIPPFDAPYAPLLANARTDCSDAMLMIRPHPRSIIAGTSRFDRKNGASRLRRIVQSQSADVRSSIGLRML